MKLSIMILTILLSSFMLSFENNNLIKTNQIIPPSASAVSKLKLLSDDWLQDGLALFISGVIENTSNKKFKVVCISFKLLDEEKNNIGDAKSCVNQLDAGEKWKFKAMVTKRDAKYYKFIEIIGYWYEFKILC